MSPVNQAGYVIERLIIKDELEDQAMRQVGTADAPIQGYLTGVGSRNITLDQGELLLDLAEVQTTRGYHWRSGGAAGSDEQFHQGAMRSPRFREIGVSIFLPWNGFKREGLPTLYDNPEEGIYDTSRFENIKQAEEIALKARGSWEGLKQGGIKLHTRNAYQPLGRTLDQPSKALICCAEPAGKKGGVKGGTNTAVQIALDWNIPVYNIYKDEDRKRIEDFVRQHRGGLSVGL